MRSCVVGLVCLLVLLFSAATYSHADIYKFVDKDGVIHFTNVPIDPRYEPLGWEVEFERYIVNYDGIIRHMSSKHGVEAALIKAVIKAESNFDPGAISRKGAMGLMQLMPETAQELKVSDPYDPKQNIDGGTRYLKYLNGRFNKNLKLVIAAYNAGGTAVEKYGNSVPPYKETKEYVTRVTKYLASYRKQASLSKVDDNIKTVALN